MESRGLVPQVGVDPNCETAQLDSTTFPLTPALSHQGRGRMVLDLRMHVSDRGGRGSRALYLFRRAALL